MTCAQHINAVYYSPMQTAVNKGKKDVIKKLLELGASADLRKPGRSRIRINIFIADLQLLALSMMYFNDKLACNNNSLYTSLLLMFEVCHFYRRLSYANHTKTY